MNSLNIIKKIVEIIDSINQITAEHSIQYIIEDSLNGVISNFEWSLPSMQNYLKTFVNHIQQFIKRDRLNILLNTPIISNDILPIYYTLAQLICNEIEKTFLVNFSTNEKQFISLYIGTLCQAVKRETEKFNVVIVCQYGMSTGILLKENLLQHFPQMNIVSVMSTFDLVTVDIEDIDLIITTTPQKINNSIPTLIIEPKLSTLNHSLVNKTLQKLSLQTKAHETVLQKDVVILTSLDYKNVLKEMLEYTFKSECIVDKLYNQLVEREQIASTAFNNCVSFPHVLTTENIESRLILGISEKGINWMGSKVNVIFLSIFSQHDKNIEPMFRNLYHFANDVYNIEIIIKEKNTTYLDHFMKGMNSYEIN